MKRRFVIGVLSLMLAGLQYRLWVSDGGVFDASRQNGVLQTQDAENTRLRQRNAALEAEVADLRTGGAAIEAHARNTLGMIRKGETFYLVVEPSAP
ncbi:MAG: septum formation initiator family protein [Nevskia sp.]|nr:septum formation initiator family protein [Nevskia sp.]